MTYRFSVFFARSLPVLTAFLASSLPAPGGRTEERGGTGARRNAPPQTEGTLAGWRGFFSARRSRGQAGIDDDDEGAGGATAQSDRGAAGATDAHPGGRDGARR